MMNARLEQTESGDFTVANDFREVGIVVDPHNAGTTTVSNVSQVRMTYALKLESIIDSMIEAIDTVWADCTHSIYPDEDVMWIGGDGDTIWE